MMNTNPEIVKFKIDCLLCGQFAVLAGHTGQINRYIAVPYTA